MKKVILILLCFKLSAQQYKVIYKVVPTFGTLESLEAVKPENVNFMQSLVAGSDEALKLMSYSLVVHQKLSLFEISDDETKLKNYFARISATDDKYLIVNDSTYQLMNNRIAKKLAVIVPPKINWILENESKIINGYNCYKAKIELPWRNGAAMNGGKPTYFVTAWYCPKIPIKHGPKGFGNLPGLILELQDNKVTFQATTVTFENVPIIAENYLKDYKTISEEKYLENIREMAKAMKYSK